LIPASAQALRPNAAKFEQELLPERGPSRVRLTVVPEGLIVGVP